QVVVRRAVRAPVPAEPALGEREHFAGRLAQHLADDLLRVPEAVHRGGVDPVHPGVERVVQGGDGLLVVLRSPAVAARAADRPRTDPDDGDLRPVLAERAELHAGLLGFGCPAGRWSTIACGPAGDGGAPAGKPVMDDSAASERAKPTRRRTGGAATGPRAPAAATAGGGGRPWRTARPRAGPRRRCSRPSP